MKYTVALFAYQREQLGSQVEVEAEPTVAAVMEALKAKGLAVDQSRLAVNKEFASATDTIEPEAVLALIPPVSGG